LLSETAHKEVRNGAKANFSFAQIRKEGKASGTRNPFAELYLPKKEGNVGVSAHVVCAWLKGGKKEG